MTPETHREGIMVSQVSQTEKVNYMTALICGMYEKSNEQKNRKQTHKWNKVAVARGKW